MFVFIDKTLISCVLISSDWIIVRPAAAPPPLRCLGLSWWSGGPTRGVAALSRPPPPLPTLGMERCPGTCPSGTPAPPFLRQCRSGTSRLLKHRTVHRVYSDDAFRCSWAWSWATRQLVFLFIQTVAPLRRTLLSIPRFSPCSGSPSGLGLAWTHRAPINCLWDGGTFSSPLTYRGTWGVTAARRSGLPFQSVPSVAK